MTPDWARKQDAERRAEGAVSSNPTHLNRAIRVYLGIALALAFAGAVAGRWTAHLIMASAVRPTPALLIIGTVLAAGLIAALGIVAKRFGSVAAGAVTFVVLGFLGSLTFFLLLAQRP